MRKYEYTIHLQHEPEGGHTVTVPALPGLVSYGETYQDAMKMAQDAVRCYLSSLEKDGEPMPIDSGPSAQEFISRVVLEPDDLVTL